MTKVNNWLSYSPRAAANEAATIQIFDQIGEDWFSNSGITAKSFAETLQAVGPGPLNVEINSPGGNVWDGLAIYNMLRGRQAPVTTRVVGVAASIASIIALAGDTVEIADAALMMIHDPSGLAAGTSDDMRKMADALDQHAAILSGVYEKKTGKTASAIRAAMKAETWFTSSEAITFGLADKLSEEKPAMEANAARAWFRASLPKLSTGSISAVADGANTAPTSQTPHNMDNKTPDPVVPAAPAAPAPAAPTAIDIDAIVAKAVAAAISAKAPTAAPAPEPVAPVRIENLGNGLLEKHKGFRAGAERQRFLIENHSELLRQNRLIAPQNANTFASGLVVDYLADAVITVATAKLAMVSGFTRNVGLDNLRPRATVQVKKFTTGDATVDNASNFEDGAANQSTLAATSVTVNQITKTFTVTQQELNQGFALSDLAQGSAEIFALGISKKITAQMTSALFGAGTTIGTAANFDSSDIPAILALAKNYRQKLLLLDGGHMARLMFSGQFTAAAGTNPFPDSRYGPLNNGYFGFANILEQNDWTGAIANTAGFVCGQDAIAVASGLPVGMIAGEFLEQRTVELSNGLSVLLSVWYSRASRAHMASYDIMFGAAAADTTQAEVLITA
jgi:ATP-dependent protease ClpP protease subunit